MTGAGGPKHFKKVNNTPIFKKGRKESLRNDKLVDLTSVPGKAIDQILLKTISKHKKAKKVMESSQYRFMMEKLCLSNLAAFYDETGLGRAMDVVSLDFRKVFNSLPFHPHRQTYLVQLNGKQ